MRAQRFAGAVAGSLVAGVALTALLMAMERKSGRPNEIVTLQRRSAERVGLDAPSPDQLPSSGEQWLAQGGHLLLSAASGVAYATVTDAETRIVPSGLLFGAGLYAALQWLAGPLLGVKPPEWRSDGRTIAMHATNHLLFGLITATGTKLAER